MKSRVFYGAAYLISAVQFLFYVVKYKGNARKAWEKSASWFWVN